MKNRIPIYVIVLCFPLLTMAQPAKKQPAKDKAPTKKEMADMMKEMQGAIGEMSPEDKKTLDSLGFKMPDVKSIQKSVSGISDAQLKKAYENENRIVPVKDAARIQAAIGTTVSTSGMAAYIDKAHEFVLGKMLAGIKVEADKIYQQTRLQKSDIGKTAVFLWIYGKPMHALYLAGMASKGTPTDADYLNNYAAFLTMAGAEQIALPILENLNKQYPKNSTILNNICQAWFGLGDIDRANKYADSVLRIYAYHPQANLTKCLIEESKGNIPAAIEAAKRSVRKGYSQEKENKLNKLGYKLKPADLDWDRPMPQDAMGLAKFTWPEYPLEVDKTKLLGLEWITFRENCDKQLKELSKKMELLEKETEEQNKKRLQEVIQASQQGMMASIVPLSTAKAIVKLRPMIESDLGNNAFVFADELQSLQKVYDKVAEREDVLDAQQKVIDEKYEGQIGEGRTNPLEAICRDENAIRNEFLKINHDLEVAFKGYQQTAYRRINNLLYYYQYTQWPDQFELSKVWAQMAWLQMLRDQKVMFKDKSHWCVKVNVNPQKSSDSLQQFDDVACKYTSTMNLGGGEIISQCSRTIVKLSVPGIDFNMKHDVEANRIISGSVMVGVSKSLGATKGPIGAEVEANAGVGVEFDNTGVTNVAAVAGVSVNAAGQTVVGIEGRVSVNGGPSISGKGLLLGK
jgi:hypothetical protein